jgi:hypothetical protein
MEPIMDQPTFEKLAVDVAKYFSTPEALLADKDLSREQKLALLRQWEYDLHLLQVATEENMTGDSPPGANAETIRALHAAAKKLGADINPDESGAVKTGAIVRDNT